ncbi:MAG: hypothetical protein IPK19_04520 [Chloroflexi bacterium]|nr:hypothetical protein [Chloroflexota bacterium]
MMIAILQVAIGLIFVFSLLSILVTTINTLVANLLKTRARFLKLGIMSLITDPELQSQFLSHPLVKLVRVPMIQPGYVASASEAQEVAAQVQKADVTQLSWIDPKMFAQVVSSLLIEKSEVTLYGPLLITADALPDSRQKDRVIDLTFGLQGTGIGLDELRAGIYELPTEYQPHLFAALEPIETRLKDARNNGTGGLLPLLEGIRKVNDDAFRRAMKVLVGSARSLDEAQLQLANWFDTRMDQVSNLFQRTMTVYSVIIGLILVLLLNVDTLNMTQTLWNEPALREAVSIAATEAVQSGILQEQMNQAQREAEAAQDTSTDPTFDSVQTFEVVLKSLLELNLPIGWAYVPVEGGCFIAADQVVPSACSSANNLYIYIPGNSPDWGGLILRKLIGIVVTIIAVAQGAPFWFDLLNRLVRGK